MDQDLSNKPNNIFIVGDSMTKILSANKISDKDIKVQIKSHPGGRISTLKNSLQSANVANTVQSAKVIVIHAGTNNVADADSPNSISDQMKETVASVKQTNPSAKFIISGIIPRKNDKLINGVINTTNRSLQKMCQEEGLFFQNNDQDFIKDNQPTTSLFYDHIHLNHDGARVFGSRLKFSIRAVLGLSNMQHLTDTGDRGNRGTKENFDTGRSFGRSQPRNPRYRRNNTVYMPVRQWAFRQPGWY